MTIVLFTILSLYAVLLFWFALGLRLTRRHVAADLPLPGISIVVCARDEEKTIAGCLLDILKQDYAHNKLQLVFVNDGSTDNTLPIAQTILRNSGADHLVINNDSPLGKKTSITRAVNACRFDTIILRDADTATPSTQWLNAFATGLAAESADMLIAPLKIIPGSTLAGRLQETESSLLMLVTAGSAYFHVPLLAASANLLFTKKAWQMTSGFHSHLHYPSGDDVLFMEDLRKAGGAIRFLRSNDVMVSTAALSSWTGLLKQRIRWAAKVGINKNPLNRLLAVLIFVVNLLFLVSCVLLAADAWRISAALFISLKITIDLLLLFLAREFMHRSSSFFYALPLALVYPFYAVAVGLGTLITKPTWK